MKPFLKKLWHFRLIIIVVLAIAGSIGTTIVLANTQQVMVQANILNIRTGPGLAYDVTEQVTKGTRLNVISEENGWYQVRLSETKVGWVASWLIKNTEVSATSNQIGLVNTGATSIYATNSTSATALKQLNAGTKVTVLYSENGWYQIKNDGSVAWIQASKVKLTNQVETDAKTTNTGQETTTTTSATNKVVVVDTDNTALREQPSTTATVITRLKKDTKLTYVKTVAKWYEVKTSDNKTGYVANSVVSLADKATLDDTMPQIASNLAEATIVLDPGHGGNDVGALSLTDKYEKTYTLATAKRIASKLRAAGANVILTRSDDSFVDLSPRVKAANKVKADAFISIHFDSADSANLGTGFTTYYFHENRDKKLAQLINQQLSILPLTNRGVEYGNFQVLRDNERPAVLLELGYINTKKDFSYIQKTSYQDKIASAIVNALTSYFN